MKPASAFFLAAALFALTLLAMPRMTHIEFVDQPSVATQLPDRMPSWSGRYILFCQNPAHGETLILDERPALCPDCGGELNPLSSFELAVLPADTRADKRQYTRTDGAILQAAIVFSGRDRSSIHRPEVCLIAAGTEIVGRRIHTVSLPNQKSLALQLLDVQQTYRLPDGRTATARSYFAYWFAGRGRETASQPARMFWMAWDRIVHNRAYPWAYISIAGAYDRPGTEPLQRLDDLVQQIYPLLHQGATSSASAHE